MYLRAGAPIARVRQLLGVRASIEEIDRRCAPGARTEMTLASGRHTVPQIFIGATHVGGCATCMRSKSAGRLIRY